MPSKLHIIRKESEVDELIAYCKKTGWASVDFETTSFKYYSSIDYPLILGVSFQPGSAWILPLGHKDSPFAKNGRWKKLFRKFNKAVIENPNIIKVAWNLKFEYKWFMAYGSFMKGTLYDAMLAKYCLDEERPHDLKSFVAKFYPEFAGYENALKIKEGGDETDEVDWANTDFKTLCEYCGKDCDLTLRGMIYLEGRLMKLGFYNLFRNLLMMITRVLAESEYRGMLIDRPYLEKLVSEYKVKINEAETTLRNVPSVLRYERKYKRAHVKKLIRTLRNEIKELVETGGKQGMITTRENKIKKILEGQFTKKDSWDGLNFGSPKQLAEFLFLSKYGLKLKVVKYTTNKKTKKESENPSTDEETLEALKAKDKSGFMEALLNLRGLTKLNSTYIEGMLPLLDSNDRVHAGFLIHGTVTGRLSCLGMGSKILTNKGIKNIEDFAPLKMGKKKVTGYKALTHTGEYQKIEFGINNGEQEVYEVELENGQKIIATLDHKFLTNKGWLCLSEIYNTNCSISKDLIIYG